MSEKYPAYSIQQTYIIKPVSKSEKRILTCNQRIDIPTIEPLSNVDLISSDNDVPLTVIPCIELAGEFLSEFDLTFETNEGVTVLPIKIAPGSQNPFGNPYMHFRYVLVLPRGATGVKSCKLIYKATGQEVQHNFTFGIMPPPYNYDNALFGYLYYQAAGNSLKLSTKPLNFEPIKLPKDAGKQTINIEDGVLFYDVMFIYASSVEPMTHKPKITLYDGDSDFVYTLSLNKTMSVVSIDLFTGKLTVYDPVNGEIFQQFMLAIPFNGFETLSFENFYDINTYNLQVYPKGARVI